MSSGIHGADFEDAIDVVVHESVSRCEKLRPRDGAPGSHRIDMSVEGGERALRRRAGGQQRGAGAIPTQKMPGGRLVDESIAT
jgi:hypothetical protein